MHASERRLGDSPFNYASYNAARFVHYYQQIHHVMALRPARVLEVGPGDHTVADFLTRKGIEVRTLDVDPALRPDYLADLLCPLPVTERFDVVLASEVLEHFRFEDVPAILDRLASVLAPGGHLVVSVPYSTIRLFPPDARYGRFLSCEGRVHTGLPYWTWQLCLTIARAVYRMARRREGPAAAFRWYRVFPDYPRERHDSHHWDAGVWPTTRRQLRAMFATAFEVVEEVVCRHTNAAFFVLRRRR